jgi:hypothetical protein
VPGTARSKIAPNLFLAKLLLSRGKQKARKFNVTGQWGQECEREIRPGRRSARKGLAALNRVGRKGCTRK